MPVLVLLQRNHQCFELRVREVPPRSVSNGCWIKSTSVCLLIYRETCVSKPPWMINGNAAIKTISNEICKLSSAASAKMDSKFKTKEGFVTDYPDGRRSVLTNNGRIYEDAHGNRFYNNEFSEPRTWHFEVKK